MLTLTYSQDTGLKIVGAPATLYAFPQKDQKDGVSLVAVPEEETREGVVSWPGEYDRSGILVRGVAQDEGRHVSYLVEADGVRFACIASPLKEWDESGLEGFGDVHVLVVPAEQTKISQKLLEEIDPRLVIITPAADGKVDPDALKALGGTGKEETKEYKIKGLPSESREVLVMG